jgi:hypothetical protein
VAARAGGVEGKCVRARRCPRRWNQAADPLGTAATPSLTLVCALTEPSLDAPHVHPHRRSTCLMPSLKRCLAQTRRPSWRCPPGSASTRKRPRACSEKGRQLTSMARAHGRGPAAAGDRRPRSATPPCAHAPHFTAQLSGCHRGFGLMSATGAHASPLERAAGTGCEPRPLCLSSGRGQAPAQLADGKKELILYRLRSCWQGRAVLRDVLLLVAFPCPAPAQLSCFMPSHIGTQMASTPKPPFLAASILQRDYCARGASGICA